MGGRPYTPEPLHRRVYQFDVDRFSRADEIVGPSKVSLTPHQPAVSPSFVPVLITTRPSTEMA
jgi:hypothetical protein